MTKNLLYVLIGAIVVLAGVYFVGSQAPVKEPLGGSDILNSNNPIFSQGLRGGKNIIVQVLDNLGKIVSPVISDPDNSIPTVTGTSTATLTAAQICANTVINVSFVTATGTVTLPSAATLLTADDCLKNNGDRYEFAIRNSTSSGEFVLANGASSTLMQMNLSSSTETSVRTGTTTIQTKQTGFLRGYKISSSTDWIIWQLNLYR